MAVQRRNRRRAEMDWVVVALFVTVMVLAIAWLEADMAASRE
jgi:type VI protein secretion system component VasF